jgi:hypothetical protein
MRIECWDGLTWLFLTNGRIRLSSIKVVFMAS